MVNCPGLSGDSYWLGDYGVMGRPTMCSPEVRERAVGMVSEHRGEYSSEWAAICSVAVAVRVFAGGVV